MPVKEIQALPPAPAAKEYLRVYSCPICPFAEVCRIDRMLAYAPTTASAVLLLLSACIDYRPVA